MRIKVGDQFAFDCTVTVDGTPAKLVFEASEEGGWVREIRTRPDGSIVSTPDGQSAATRMRAGSVRITIPKAADPGHYAPERNRV